MPQPISKKRVEEYRHHPHVKFTKHKMLGYIAEYIVEPPNADPDLQRFAYRMDRDGTLLWVTEKTIKLRMKTGHGNPAKPQAFKQRKKPILPDSTFSLDELEQAAAIIKDLP